MKVTNKFFNAKQSQAFNATERNNPLYEQRYLATGPQVNAIYFPDYKAIKPRVGSNVKMIDPATYQSPRATIPRIADCILNSSDLRCSFAVRKELRMIREKNHARSLNQQGHKLQWRNLTSKGKDHDRNITPEHDAIKARVIPNNLKYAEVQKFGRQNVKFSRMGNRNNILATNPFPGQDAFAPANAHEARFDQGVLDIEIRSQNRNTKQSPVIEKFSPRKDWWRNDDTPDGQIYNHQEQMSYEKNRKLALGSLSFAQRPDRETGGIYVYNKFHEPDHDKVIAAKDDLKKSSKIKGSHQMSL